jgi:hypothetical protein
LRRTADHFPGNHRVGETEKAFPVKYLPMSALIKPQKGHQKAIFEAHSYEFLGWATSPWSCKMLFVHDLPAAKSAEARVDVMRAFIRRLRPEDIEWLRREAPPEFVKETMCLGTELLKLAANVNKHEHTA